MKKIDYITYDAWWDTDITIIKMLKKEYDITVHVINSPQKNKYPNKKQDNNYDILEYNLRTNKWGLYRLFESFILFISIFRAISRDSIIIYVNGSNWLFRILFLLSVRKDKTIICTHNYINHTDINTGLNPKITRLFYKKYKNFLFYSEKQHEAFVQDYPQKKSFFTNMPLKDFGQLPCNKSEKITFLFFGFVRDYKRLDLFIKAANEVQDTNALFYIAGACNSWDKYNSLIKDRSRFKLNITFINNEDIPGIFSESTFLVLPYDDSTQSGPSLIAINYGVPIIASNLPSFKAIINEGKNGYLFENGSAEALTEVFNKVLKLDTEEINKFKNEQLSFRNLYKETTDINRVLRRNNF